MSSSTAPVFDGTKGDRRYKPDTRRPRPLPTVASTPEERNEKQEFRRILQEVQKLGASQLTGKERKAYESKKLAALGAKPTKNIKMPIQMGLNTKRKREKLEADRREQDILAGFLPKAKRRVPKRESNEEKGLRLSEGIFKGGVLYVQKPETKTIQGQGQRRDTSLDKIFNSGGSKTGGKHKKGKGKKGGGKQKGGKRKH